VSEHPRAMCSRCNQLLNRVDNLNTGASFWMHADPTMETRCHPYLVLPVDESKLVSFCDFCSSPVPGRVAVVWCDPFITTHEDDEGQQVGPLVGDDGRWAACEVCADLIDAGDWAALTRHSVYCFERKHGELSKTSRKQMLREIGVLHATIAATFIRLEQP